MESEVSGYLTKSREWELALTLSRRAVRTAQTIPDSAEAPHRKISHASMLGKLGRIEEALDVLEEAEAAQPDDTIIRVNSLLAKVRVLHGAGQDSRIDRYLSEAYACLTARDTSDARIPALRAAIDAVMRSEAARHEPVGS